MDYSKIDKGLIEAIAQSPWFKIPYDDLMETNPQGIRDAEEKLAAVEEILDIPDGLIVENRVISSQDNLPDVEAPFRRKSNGGN